MKKKKDLEGYFKYYWLEVDYLKQVTKNFKRRHFLTAKEFFAIIIWKSSRQKTIIKKSIRRSGKTIRKITFKVFKVEKLEDKLKVLTQIPGIGVPIASAVLTICYPDKFTVVDRRARASLEEFDEKIRGNPTAKTYPYTAYFEYLKKCKMLACRYHFSLRDFDRILWAMDWKRDLEHFADGLN